jgi:hypothetical protein
MWNRFIYWYNLKQFCKLHGLDPDVQQVVELAVDIKVVKVFWPRLTESGWRRGSLVRKTCIHTIFCGFETTMFWQNWDQWHTPAYILEQQLGASDGMATLS